MIRSKNTIPIGEMFVHLTDFYLHTLYYPSYSGILTGESNLLGRSPLETFCWPFFLLVNFFFEPRKSKNYIKHSPAIFPP